MDKIPQIEQHPLDPFLPSEAKLLMLGSFPPKKSRWSINFYYPNRQNDMWRIMGLVFFNDKDHFLENGHFDEESIKNFCTIKGIAISDSASSVKRLNNNASDKFLEVVSPINLNATLENIPDCRTIVTTGEKATETILTIINAPSPKVGGYSEITYLGRDMKLYRMPSSSRAYPKPLVEKAAIYAKMFEDIGML